MVVAIDGPAGAGKSTVARRVAGVLGFTYLDTGAMYRAAGLADEPTAARIDLDGDRVLLDGEDVTGRLRTPEASERASVVAANPGVRRALVAQQQRLLAEGDWVAEGRDIGTVVKPDAEVKVFLTADPQERAQRRAAETGEDLEKVLADVLQRDARDTGRQDSPLVKADDAHELDTTGLTIDEVVDRIVELAL
jgi:cytidylate kinase